MSGWRLLILLCLQNPWFLIVVATPPPDSDWSATTSATPSQPEEEESRGDAGVSLGEILGILFLVCCIFYCIGIGYKIFKIMKGTYVEEEPVFLKYK